MKILLGIIFLHLVVMFRAKFAVNDRLPYLSTFFITVLLVAYVVVMLFIMAPPEL